MALFKILSRTFRRYDRSIDRNYDYAPDHAVSLACWIYGNHSSINQHLIGMPTNGYKLYLKSIDGYSHLACCIGITEVVDPDPINKLTWIHACLTWDGNKLILYKNGKEINKKSVNEIGYNYDNYGTSIWAFNETEGGETRSIGLNLFTMWGSALNKSEVEYLADLGNPDNVQHEAIRIGDFLDYADASQVFGDFLPEIIINEGIIDKPISPFKNGLVPFDVPVVIISSSTSSGSTLSSLSSLSSQTTSQTSSSSETGLSLSSGTSSSSSNTPSSLTTDESSSSGNTILYIYDIAGVYSEVSPWTEDGSITVKVWGAGGGGGGFSRNRINTQKYHFNSGGGGGGGEYSESEPTTVTAAQTIDIAIGSKGSPGGSIFDLTGGSANDGYNGSSSSATINMTTIESEGGKGATGAIATDTSNQFGIGGEGGSAYSGDDGYDGYNGNLSSSVITYPVMPEGGEGGNGGDNSSNGKGGKGGGSVLADSGTVTIPGGQTSYDITPVSDNPVIDSINYSNGIYTIPSDGTYLIIVSGKAKINNSNWSLIIKLNGNNIITQLGIQNIEEIVDLETIQNLNENDELKVIINMNNSSNSGGYFDGYFGVISDSQSGSDGKVIIEFTPETSNSSSESLGESTSSSTMSTDDSQSSAG